MPAAPVAHGRPTDTGEPGGWLEFLGEIFAHDPDAIGTLQEFIGTYVGGDGCPQKILHIMGPTRSGKGTSAAVIIHLMGHDNVAAPTLDALGERFGPDDQPGPRADGQEKRGPNQQEDAAAPARIRLRGGSRSRFCDHDGTIGPTRRRDKPHVTRGEKDLC